MVQIRLCVTIKHVKFHRWLHMRSCFVKVLVRCESHARLWGFHNKLFFLPLDIVLPNYCDLSIGFFMYCWRPITLHAWTITRKQLRLTKSNTTVYAHIHWCFVSNNNVMKFIVQKHALVPIMYECTSLYTRNTRITPKFWK